MRNNAVIIGFLALSMVALGGCLGRFAANQGRRQAARSSDYYVRKYAEPELANLYPDDPDAKVEVKKITREGRNYLADIVVRSGNERQKKRVLVDERGRLIEER